MTELVLEYRADTRVESDYGPRRSEKPLVVRRAYVVKTWFGLGREKKVWHAVGWADSAAAARHVAMRDAASEVEGIRKRDKLERFNREFEPFSMTIRVVMGEDPSKDSYEVEEKPETE